MESLRGKGMAEITDDEILAFRNHRFPRGLITVHEIWNGQVLFVSRIDGQMDWHPWRMRRSLFVEAVERERQMPTAPIPPAGSSS
jgi:hypothetical protein